MKHSVMRLCHTISISILYQLKYLSAIKLAIRAGKMPRGTKLHLYRIYSEELHVEDDIDLTDGIKLFVAGYGKNTRHQVNQFLFLLFLKRLNAGLEQWQL